MKCSVDEILVGIYLYDARWWKNRVYVENICNCPLKVGYRIGKWAYFTGLFANICKVVLIPSLQWPNPKSNTSIMSPYIPSINWIWNAFKRPFSLLCTTGVCQVGRTASWYTWWCLGSDRGWGVITGIVQYINCSISVTLKPNLWNQHWMSTSILFLLVGFLFDEVT